MSGTARTATKRPWLWRLVGLLISLAALAVVVGTVDVAAAFEILLTADPALLAVALCVITVQVLVRAWRWRIVLPPHADGSQVSVMRAVPPLLVGYLGNAVLPARLGEPIRALLVARREALVALEAFGATMLERLVDTTTLAMIGLVAALVLGAATWVVGVSALAGFGGLIVLGLIATVGVTRVTALAARILGRIGLGQSTQRLQGWSHSFAAGLDRGRSGRVLSKVVLLSIVTWVMDASIFLLVGLSIDLDITLPQAVLIGAVGVLSTAIPAAPGYVGTFELAATTIAVALGIPESGALAMAILVHTITVIPLALAGAFALLSVGVRLGELADDAQEVEHANT
jgi:glycosyltransferase 2 family protein